MVAGGASGVKSGKIKAQIQLVVAGTVVSVVFRSVRVSATCVSQMTAGMCQVGKN